MKNTSAYVLVPWEANGCPDSAVARVYPFGQPPWIERYIPYQLYLIWTTYRLTHN